MGKWDKYKVQTPTTSKWDKYKTQPQPEQAQQEIDPNVDYRSPEAQRIDRPETGREKFMRGTGAPFSTALNHLVPGANDVRLPLGGSIGGAARILDTPARMFAGMASGAALAKEGLTSAPDFATGAAEVGAGLGQLALPVAFPLASVAFGAGTSAADNLLPGTEDVVGAIGSPFTSIFKPTSRVGRAVAQVADIGTQAGGYKLGEKAPALHKKYSNFREAKNIDTGLREIYDAARPNRKHYDKYDQNLKTASKDIAESTRANPFDQKASGESHFDHAKDVVVPQAMSAIWDRVGEQVQRQANYPINGKTVVTSILNDIPSNVKLLHPQEVAQIKNYLNNFNTEIPISVLHAEISKLNAETAGFWGAGGEKRAQMLREDPLLGAKVQLSNKFRDRLFNALSETGESGAKELRQRYGALANVADVLDANKVGAARKDVSSVWNVPMRRGFIAGAISKAAGASTGMALGIEGAATVGGATSRFRGKPSQSIKRGFERLANSNLKAEYPNAPNFKGMLPSHRDAIFNTVDQIKNPKIADDGTGNRQPIILGSGQKQLPQLATSGNRGFGEVNNIPNPDLSRTLSPRTTPENFIRGTGKEGLDLNEWQRATSGNPENTMYVGQYQEPPSFNMGGTPPNVPPTVNPPTSGGIPPTTPTNVTGVYPRFKPSKVIDTPNAKFYKSEAGKLGISYDGVQKGMGAQFTDRRGTGSTFYLNEGEILADVLRKHREDWISGGGKFLSKIVP